MAADHKIAFSPSNGLKIIVALLSLFVTCLLIYTYSTKSSAFNVDILYLHFFVNDLLHTKFNIAHWQISTTPYFFPDAALYLLLFPLGTVEEVFRSYTVCIYLAIFGALLAVKREAVAGTRLLDDVVYFSLGGLIFLLIFYEAETLLWPLLVPAFHGGTLLNGLLAFLLFLKAVNGKSWIYEAALYLLVVLSSLSDPLVAAQFHIPLILAAGIAWVFRRLLLALAMRLGAGIALCSLGGIALQKILPHLGLFHIHSRLSLGEIRGFMDDLVQKYFSEMTSPPLTETAIILGLLGVTLVLLGSLRTLSARGNAYLTAGKDVFLLAVFPVLSLASFLVSYRLTSAFPILPKHGMVLYFMPAAFLLLLMSTAPARLKTWVQVFLAALAAVLLAENASLLRIQDEPVTESEYYPRVERLDAIANRYNLKYGYANYGLAKLLTVLSRTGVFINQLGNDFEPTLWVNNADWYVKDHQSYHYPHYNFIIADDITDDKIKVLFGQPRKEIHLFGDNIIYIYDRPSDLVFRNFLKVRLYQYLNMTNRVAFPKNNILKHRKSKDAALSQGITLTRGAEYIVDFDKYTYGNVLETALGGECAYKISVHTADNSRITGIDIAKNDKDELVRHYICVKPRDDVRPITTINIVAEGNKNCVIGDAFVYEDKYCEPAH